MVVNGTNERIKLPRFDFGEIVSIETVDDSTLSTRKELAIDEA